MSYQKQGNIKVTFQDGSEHDFTSIETCAGLDPEEVVEVSEVESELSSTSTMPVQNKVITGALGDKADLEDGKVPASQLPSYVDDIVAYPSLSDFPAIGEDGKIYVAKDTNLTYRWDGSSYVQVNAQDNVMTYASSSQFPASGKENVIYIAEDTNKLYRYATNTYVELSPDNVVAITTYSADIPAYSSIYGIDIGGTKYKLPFQGTSYDFDSIAIGQTSVAGASGYTSNATAYGISAWATNTYTTALGHGTQATGTSSTAVGYNASASGANSTAVGRSAEATNTYATALGRSSQATFSSSTAVGYNAQALSNYATAIGRNAYVSGANAVAIGAYSYSKIDFVASFYGYGDSVDQSKTLLIKSPSQIFFTNEDATNTTNGYTTLSSFIYGKTLKDLLDAKQDTLSTSNVPNGKNESCIGFDVNGNLVKDDQILHKKALSFTAAEEATFSNNMSSMLEFSMQVSGYTAALQDADMITLLSTDGEAINFSLYRTELLYDTDSSTYVASFAGKVILPGFGVYDISLLGNTLSAKKCPDVAEYSTSQQYNAFDLCMHDGLYYICDASTSGAWDSSKWVALPDLSQSATVASQLLNANMLLALADKQDNLISGTNIKTINNQSLLGSGNVDLQTPITTTTVPNGENASFIGFDASNNMKKEALLVMSELEIINAIYGTYDPSKIYSTTIVDTTLSYAAIRGINADVETGIQELNKLVCVDLVKNQWFRNLNRPAEATIGGVTLTHNDDGSFTLNGTATEDIEFSGANILSINVIPESDLLLFYPISNVSFSESTIYLSLGNYSGNIFGPRIGYAYGPSLGFSVKVKSGTVLDNAKIQIAFINLTERYGTNSVVNAIKGTGSQDSQVSNVIAFDPEILSDLSYDAGTLVPSKTAKLKTVDYNQFAGNSESNPQYIGHYYINNSGVKDVENNFNCFRIKVFGSTKYCLYAETGGLSTIAHVRYVDKDYNLLSYDIAGWDAQIGIKNTPLGCEYIELAIGKATTKNISLFLYWDGSRIGYEPYQEHIYDMPNYEGHGILKVVDGKVVADGDELYPDGNSKKRYGIANLSEVLFAYDSTHDVFYANASTYIPNAKKPPVESNPNIACDKYARVTTFSSMSVADNLPDKSITLYVPSDNFRIIIKDTSLNGNASGITGYLVYELATEEDIETPVFQSTFPVEQGGTLQFLDEDDNPIAGLQGAQFEFLTGE